MSFKYICKGSRVFSPNLNAVVGETRFRHKQTKAWVAENVAVKERSLGDRDAFLEAVVRGETPEKARGKMMKKPPVPKSLSANSPPTNRLISPRS